MTDIRTELIIRSVKDAVWYRGEGRPAEGDYFLEQAIALAGNDPKYVTILRVAAQVEAVIQLLGERKHGENERIHI